MTTLVVGPNWIGDMVMAQPLIAYIKSKRSDEAIHVLAPIWSLGVAQRMAEVDRCIESPFTHGGLDFFTRYRFAKEIIYPENYRRVFVLPNSMKSALIPYFAHIPRRIGWRGEWRYVLLTDCRDPRPKYFPRQIDRYFALAFPSNLALSPLLLPDDPTSPRLDFDEQNRQKWIKNLELVPERCIVLCPGAEFGPSKCWPVNNFSELANNIINCGLQTVLLGSKNDTELGESLLQNIPTNCRSKVLNLIGKTTITDAIDILSIAKIVVTNDSGLMHLAAALERSVLALYGSSSPLETPPMTNDSVILTNEVPCQPCFERVCPLDHQNCLRGLSVDLVFDKLLKHLHQPE